MRGVGHPPSQRSEGEAVVSRGYWEAVERTASELHDRIRTTDRRQASFTTSDEAFRQDVLRRLKQRMSGDESPPHEVSDD